MLRFPLALTLTALAAGGATLLEQRIDEILRTSRALPPGDIGVEVVQVRGGKVLYARNADKLFTPASNTKLFSAGLALSRLGPDYKLRTRVYAAAGPDIDGVVEGDLVLYGGGDPSMSERQIPFNRESKGGDPMEAIEALADQIAAKGVRIIRGDIVGDDTAYPYEPFPAGWAADDSVWDYGAPVSALTFNHSSFRLTVRAGAVEGAPASIDLWPPLERFAISNRVRTVAAGEQRLDIDRLPGARLVRLSGVMKIGGEEVAEQLGVDDPAQFAAAALEDALVRRGVAVHGSAVARHREPGCAAATPAGRMLVERESPPLVELARVVLKISQNLWAELLLRATAQARTGDGSSKAGVGELKAFLTEIGTPLEDYEFEDGSGLSRLTLVTPSAINRLLCYMYLSPLGEQWKGLLPVGALDGSLEKRFDKKAEAHAILAKTGSLSHVDALSGYVESATYGEVSFSILVNHTVAPVNDVRAAIDRIALALLE